MRRAAFNKAIAGIAITSTLTGLACLVQGCGSSSPTSGSGYVAQTPADQLQADTGVPWIFEIDPMTNAPSLVAPLSPIAPTAVNGVSYDAAARAFIDKYKTLFMLKDVGTELALVEVVQSGDGTGHVRYVQREGGLTVEGTNISVHFDPSGSMTMINGTILPDAAKAVGAPGINANQALAIAESDLSATFPGYARSWLDYVPVPALVLSPAGSGANLAWSFDLSGHGPNGEIVGRHFTVDASTSALLLNYPTFENTTGTGTGVLGEKQTFNIERSSIFAILWWAKFNMEQSGDGSQTQIGTYTYDAKNPNTGTLITSTDTNSWDPVGAAGAGEAVDAHAYMQVVDKYYRTNHGWASYNGQGGTIKIYVHQPMYDNGGNLSSNAFWDGNGAMHFTDAVGAVKATSAGLDVDGHELTHGVTQYTNGLQYHDEPGAINEAMSDIFGTFIEASAPPPGSSLDLIGEASWTGGLRSMPHPTAHGQPDNVKNESKLAAGTAPSNNNDMGGVHNNSGIVNNAWYLMTNGGTNDTSKIPVSKSLGMDSSRKLWWQTERNLLHATTSFSDMAKAQTTYAHNNGFAVEAVGCAWVATGVLTNKYIKDTYNVQCFCDDGDGGVLQQDQMQCCEAGASDQCCKQCSDSGAPDAGNGDSGGGQPTNPDLFDSCKGRVDGVYCSQLYASSSIVCQGGSIAMGLQCANNAKCTGPNGPGTSETCDGQPSVPSGLGGGTSGGGSSGQPAVPDSCNGRADGLYCSTISPYSAIQCTGGSVAGGAQCPTGKLCAGPNGPGQIVCQ